MENLTGKRILITGGAGTLGLALVEYILNKFDQVESIIIFSRDEYKHFEVKLKSTVGKHPKLVFKIGDIRDKERLMEVMPKVDIVIHTAAIKQVSSAEENTSEAYKTNVLGTTNVLEVAKANGVEKFIFISSDKAVNPVNYYGVTKKLGEAIVLNEQTMAATVVRLGNLIGSKGSVFEAFEYQSKQGELQVSSLDAERYFISLENAVKAVLFSINDEFNGKIFIPKANKIKLGQLIEEKFSGIPFRINGLKPYERLTESLYDHSDLEKLVFFDSFVQKLVSFQAFNEEA
jgi:FlaA1/EpsC-like NDP-sugar epimerase